jgi:hypothetical protein
MFPGAVCDVVFCMRIPARVLALATAGLLSACGAAGARPESSGSVRPAATGSPAAPAPAGLPSPGVPLRTPPTAGPRTLVARDQDNGHAVSLRVGDHLLLVLASTYWQLDGSSAPNVLRETGQPAVSPQVTGCVGGQGCGTVSATFDAVAAGTAQVTARRTSCGEALSCSGSLGSYRVTVLVTS